MSDSQQQKHGGHRRGAGRPKGSTKTPAEKCMAPLSVRLTPAERARAEHIGGGNASRGMRVALQAYPLPDAKPDAKPVTTPVESAPTP